MKKDMEFINLYELKNPKNILRISYLNPEIKSKLDFNVFEVSLDLSPSELTKNFKHSVRIKISEIPKIKEKLTQILSHSNNFKRDDLRGLNKGYQDFYRVACACYDSQPINENHGGSCDNVLRISQDKITSDNFEVSISIDDSENQTRRRKLTAPISISEIKTLETVLDKIGLDYKIIMGK